MNSSTDSSAAQKSMPLPGIVTRAGEPRQWQLCFCGDCGGIARCTPTFDFYARGTGSPKFRPGIDGKPDSPIYCAVCTFDGQR